MLVDRETRARRLHRLRSGRHEHRRGRAKTPEKIATVQIDPATGYMPRVGRRIASALELDGDQVGNATG